MLDTTAITRRFTNIRSNAATTFTFSGTDYTGVKTNKALDINFVDAGLSNDYQWSLQISLSDFETAPAVSDLITVSGTEYRVLDIEDDSLGIIRTLALGSKYQNA